ncbi:unnamed protein product [Clonostachys rosea]|uniref:Uncharacterized protein n=1 Tax=Bionectria ochroleuca TaxID=29856 RepID=A0ABY6V2F4_BIOOC|nr:unnamed protein product [Clonostachys rosea]
MANRGWRFCNEIFHDAAGLEQGFGVSRAELTACYVHSGQEAATLETKGSLTCYKLDGFGRTLACRSRNAAGDQATMRAANFFAQSPYVADGSLPKLLGNTDLCPQRRMSF